MPDTWWMFLLFLSATLKAAGSVVTLLPRCNSLPRVITANLGLSCSKTPSSIFTTFPAHLLAYCLHLETLLALRSLLVYMSSDLLLGALWVWLWCLNIDFAFDHNTNVYFYHVAFKQECWEVLVLLLTLSRSSEFFRVSLGRIKPRQPGSFSLALICLAGRFPGCPGLPSFMLLTTPLPGCFSLITPAPSRTPGPK